MFSCSYLYITKEDTTLTDAESAWADQKNFMYMQEKQQQVRFASATRGKAKHTTFFHSYCLTQRFFWPHAHVGFGSMTVVKLPYTVIDLAHWNQTSKYAIELVTGRQE